MLLVWIDPPMREQDDHYFDTMKNLYDIVDDASLFAKVDVALEYLMMVYDQRVTVIVSAATDDPSIKQIHALSCAYAICMFAIEAHIHSSWQRKFPKIRGSCDHITSVYEALRRTIRATHVLPRASCEGRLILRESC